MHADSFEERLLCELKDHVRQSAHVLEDRDRVEQPVRRGFVRWWIPAGGAVLTAAVAALTVTLGGTPTRAHIVERKPVGVVKLTWPNDREDPTGRRSTDRWRRELAAAGAQAKVLLDAPYCYPRAQGRHIPDDAFRMTFEDGNRFAYFDPAEVPPGFVLRLALAHQKLPLPPSVKRRLALAHQAVPSDERRGFVVVDMVPVGTPDCMD
ncbi:hypothetical protein [Streptomyces sp. NPDC089919]|uniref:hypothetical protein n=1 Tax=Streptomyces sp. NPDC089919 TaxID=3155188 RepID=UPI0034285BFE